MSEGESTSIERKPSGIVLWTGSHRDAGVIVCENEGIFEGGRSPTNGPSGTMGEMSRQIPQRSESIRRTKRPIKSVGKEGMIIPFNSTPLREDCQFAQT